MTDHNTPPKDANFTLTGLARDVDPEGVCKYALIRIDRLPRHVRDALVAATDPDQPMSVLNDPHRYIEIPLTAIEVQRKGAPDESFVLKLKDRFSAAALYAYAEAASSYGMTAFGDAVRALAARSGSHHPFCKTPD